MAISNLRDLLIEQLQDLYNSEEQIRSAYSRWKDSSGSDELRGIFDQHIQQSDQRKNNIETICDELGVSPTGEKCEGTQGLITEGDELLKEIDEGPIKDAGLIASAQRLEHYGMAGYGCARTYALQLDMDDAAELLQNALDTAAEMDERMTELAETTLNRQAAAQT